MSKINFKSQLFVISVKNKAKEDSGKLIPIEILKKNSSDVIPPDDMNEGLISIGSIDTEDENPLIIHFDKTDLNSLNIFIKTKKEGLPLKAETNFDKGSQPQPSPPNYTFVIENAKVKDNLPVNFHRNVTYGKHPDFAAICTEENWKNPSVLSVKMESYFINHVDANGKYPYRGKLNYPLYCLGRLYYMAERFKLREIAEGQGFDVTFLSGSDSLNIIIYNIREISKGDTLIIKGEIDITKIPNDFPGFDTLKHYFNDVQPEVEIILSALNLEFIFFFKPTHQKVRIPHASDSRFSKGLSLKNTFTEHLKNPRLKLSYAPAFKFGIAQIIGTLEIPYSSNWDDASQQASSKTDDLELTLSATLTNEEINLAAEFDKQNMFTSPILQGINFDSVGIEGGIFFEPPGIDFGLTGKFHVGPDIPAEYVKDDAFGIVLNIEEEVPKPVYLNFYINQLDIKTLVEVFTNETNSLDFPVTLDDLAFYYASNAVVLPNGHLTDIGMKLSLSLLLFEYHFRGMFSATFGTGIKADIQSDPIDIAECLKLSGTGTEQFVYKDKDGNVVDLNKFKKAAKLKTMPDGSVLYVQTDKNGKIVVENFSSDDAVPSSYQAQKYIKTDNTGQTTQVYNTSILTKHTLVQAGGPFIKVNLPPTNTGDPIFDMDLHAEFLGVLQEDIKGKIDKDSISFSLDSQQFGLIHEDINININYADGKKESFEFDFFFGLRKTILGINIDTGVDTDVKAVFNNSTEDLDFSVKLTFDLVGKHLTLGPVDIDLHLKKIDDVLGPIISKIEEEAETLLGPIFQDAEQLVKWVKNGALLIEGSVMNLLSKPPLEKEKDEAARLLKDAGYVAEEVMHGLVEVWRLEAKAAADILHGVGYAASEVGKALTDVYHLTTEAAADILHGVGYAVDKIKEWAGDAWHYLNPHNW